VTDPDRLTQVFINLISNAQKYCEAEAPDAADRGDEQMARACLEDLRR
jgi:signal transduction histidine kinase